MTRSLTILGAIGALLLPTQALGANWLSGCQTPGSTNNSLTPSSFACNIPVSATDHSGILSTACENIDILYYDDADGDAVAAAATLRVRSCPSPVADIQGCWNIENVLLDGNPATNTEAIYGAAAEWIMVEMVSYTTTTEPIRVIIRCNGPS